MYRYNLAQYNIAGNAPEMRSVAKMEMACTASCAVRYNANVAPTAFETKAGAKGTLIAGPGFVQAVCELAAAAIAQAKRGGEVVALLEAKAVPGPGNIIYNSGTSGIALETTATGKSVVTYGPSLAPVHFTMASETGRAWLARYGGKSEAILESDVSGDAGVIRNADPPGVTFEMTSSGGYTGIYGSDVIHLEGITIPPGSELVIDTDEMTITLDGVNIIRYLTNDSVFFSLHPGNNMLRIEGEDMADVFVIWKDRWL